MKRWIYACVTAIGWVLAMTGCSAQDKAYGSPGEIAAILKCDGYAQSPATAGSIQGRCSLGGVPVAIQLWTESGGREDFVEFAEKNGSGPIVVGENWVVQIAPGYAEASADDVAKATGGEVKTFSVAP